MRHQTISFIKSALRLTGYLALGSLAWLPIEFFVSVWILSWGTLVLSEVVGVIEEIGHE